MHCEKGSRAIDCALWERGSRAIDCTVGSRQSLSFSNNGNIYIFFSRKKKKPQRCDPRQLQRENSDGVWNELAYFKTQHRKLEVERSVLIFLLINNGN